MLRDTEAKASQKKPWRWNQMPAKKGKRPIRFRGLVAAAREFGVHRNHLYLCLAGKRVSRSLIAKWKDLKSRTAKAA